MTEEEANLLTLAQDTYSWGGGAGVVPPVSSDDWNDAGYEFAEPPEDIAAMFNSESGFKANLYKKKDTEEYVLAIAGTDLFSPKDWITDGDQALGNTPEQFNEALILTDSLKQVYGESLSITGHSLGGGLASYVASQTGLNATTFNAAGLHPDNIKKGDEGLNVNAIVLTGDILNVMQDLTPITPNVFGVRKTIGNPIASVYVATQSVAGGPLGSRAAIAYGSYRHGAFDRMRELLRNE